MADAYLQSLTCPLPEDIAALKGAGEFELARRAIERRLAQGPEPMLRQRLETERLFLSRLGDCYPYTHDQLLLAMRKRVPSFTDAELEELLLDGKLDFIYVDGVRRYHEDLVSSLLKSQPALNRRAEIPYNADRTALEAAIRRVMAGNVTFRYRLRADTHVRSHEANTLYRVHMPIPARSMQQEPARDVASSLTLVRLDDERALQRTAYLEGSLRYSPDFWVEYTCVQHPKYVDPMDESLRGPVYPDALPPSDEDLCEQPPHLCFAPYLRALAGRLASGERDPVRLARRFYDYITSHVTYAYLRPYQLMERGAEYTAVNLRGDCGVQALLFIALCRISGIPARWQSGLYAAPGDVGSHDWAEFYSERLGWLPADCSFGGAGYRDGSKLRRAFYFGNLDPWRMVANRAYYAPFAPEKRFPRADPYDSQRGEIETDTRGLTGSEFRTRYTMLWHEETEE